MGGALWLPPGIHPDGDGLIALLQENLESPVLDEAFSILEQMDRLHPEEPCWHLAFIAVDPTQQNKGLGSALLEHLLPTCDRDKTLAYLESTNPANLSLYERHGFKLLEKMQAGSSPPMFAMIREPRLALEARRPIACAAPAASAAAALGRLGQFSIRWFISVKRSAPSQQPTTFLPG